MPMRRNARGLEELSMAIALDIEPHDPPKGMADRIFARIEAESAPPPSPTDKVNNISRGLLIKTLSASAAALLVLVGAAYYCQQKTVAPLDHGRAENTKSIPNKDIRPTDKKVVEDDRKTNHDQTPKGTDADRETHNQSKQAADDRVTNYDRSNSKPKANIRREEEKATVPPKNGVNKKDESGNSGIGGRDTDQPSTNHNSGDNGGNLDRQSIQSTPDDSTQQQTTPTPSPQTPTPPTQDIQRTDEVQMADERQPIIQADIAIGRQRIQAGISIQQTPPTIEVRIASNEQPIIQVEITKQIIERIKAEKPNR